MRRLAGEKTGTCCALLPDMNRLLVAAAAVLFPALCGGCEGASIGGSGAEAADAAEVAGTADASMPISESALVDSGAELPEEICDGQDNDQDGEVDEGCICEVGLKQSCFVGDTAKQGVGACNFGTQTCIPEDEFSRWGACTGSGAPQNEICDNEIDDDCNGAIDDGPDCNMPIILEVDISIDGDCITANCPAVAPYPVGCEIRFAGGDS